MPKLKILLKGKCFDSWHPFNFSFDSVTIHDGGSMGSPIIGKFCNSLVPPSVIFSTSNELLIHFDTNMFGNHKGFEIEFKVLGKFFGCNCHW